MGARLVFRDAHGKDGALQLGQQAIYVGRANECAVRTDDALVSRRHSRIENVDGGWRVRDLGSSNGTKVNDERVDVHALVHNDVITCGTLWIRFESDPPPLGARLGTPPPEAAPAVEASPELDTVKRNKAPTLPPPSAVVTSKKAAPESSSSDLQALEEQNVGLAKRVRELLGELAGKDREIERLRSTLQEMERLMKKLEL